MSARARFTLLAIGLAAAQLLCSCSDDDREVQRLIRQNIEVVGRQVQMIGAGRQENLERVQAIEDALNRMSMELSRSRARVKAARVANAYLGDLTARKGDSHIGWIMRNPAVNSSMIAVIIAGLMVVWVLWRVRQRHIENEAAAEIDRVISRLTREASATQPPAPAAGVETRIAITPAPAPEPPAPKKAGPSAPAKKKPAPPKKAAPAKKPAGPVRKSATKKKPGKPAAKKAARKVPARKCKVKGCKNKHRSKGYCNKHYQQWRRGTLEEDGS